MDPPDERPADRLFDQLRDAIDGGQRFDMSVRELRACANVLEMHVAEETPAPQIVDAIHALILDLAELRQLPQNRLPKLHAALRDIRHFAFP